MGHLLLRPPLLLAHTLKCDGGNEAAAAAAVAVRMPFSIFTGSGVPGSVVVVLGVARRTDEETQLCIS